MQQRHVLAASREQGHCYLTFPQINAGIIELIEINLEAQLLEHLMRMEQEHQLKTRVINNENQECTGYGSVENNLGIL